MTARAASPFPFYFTRDPEGLREMFAVSSSVGSGKTKAAIEYIASSASGMRNILYVAPTIRLLEQTHQNLIKELTKAGSARSPNGIHVVHSQARDREDIPTAMEVLKAINDTSANLGRVVILTTVTFLTIVADIETPEDWTLILDEAFAPVEFSDFYPGHGQQTREAHLAAFHKAFEVDRMDFFRVTPRAGMKETLRAAAAGDFRKAGSMMRGYQDLAKLTLNPALRTEVVATPKAVALLDKCAWPSSEDADDEDATTAKLTLVSYATPEYFQGFSEVIFMSALFERTMLHALWTKVFGVSFSAHPTIKPGRDLHIEQGQHVSVGHLLHRGDTASKHNLGRNRYDSTVGETEEGDRVIDVLVEQADEFFAGRKYLLQVNRGYGYDDDDGSKLLRKYPNATKIPTAAHGLNDYQQWDNVAALAVTNPLPQHCEWIMARTGFTKAQTNQSYRIHTTYQAVGRTSVRNPKRAKQAKVFLCVGYEDAKLLHDTFEGSQWLGRVGDVPRLSDLNVSPKRAGAVDTLANAGRTYLYALPDTTREISSRALKEAIAPKCSSKTWTRVTQEIRRGVSGWRWAGSSFIRTDAEFYGFTQEETASV